MPAVVQLSLFLTCVLGWVSVLALPMEDSMWRLELEPYGAHHSRAKRQTFPGTGMPCLTVAFLTDMKQRFAERIDPNDDGKATYNEVGQYLTNFNPRVSKQQIATFIRRRDLNGNGVIEFVPEYILDIATPDMTLDAASEWFGLEDSDGDGYVSRAELLRIAQELGMTPEQADADVSSFYMSEDTNGDDKLSFDEYKVLYGQ